MKNQTARSRPNERGQSLVEFAISLTFMLILLAGAVDFSIGLFHYSAMRDAAQEGALFGSTNPDNQNGIRERIRNASGDTGLIRDLYDAGTLSVAITYSGAHCAGNGITITLTYTYQPTTPFVGAFSREIPLTATVTDTILSPAC